MCVGGSRKGANLFWASCAGSDEEDGRGGYKRGAGLVESDREEGLFEIEV